MKINLINSGIIILLTMGCSLKYAQTPVVEDKVPEFLFENASLVRRENDKIMVELEAEELEQYRNSSDTYGQGIKFTSYEDGEIDTTGSCNYIFANSDINRYQLYDDIFIENYTENMTLKAQALKWDGKTEQLISSRGDVVEIKKDDTTMRGTGFSASGVSKDFSFKGNVLGDIETKEEEQEDENLDEELSEESVTEDLEKETHSDNNKKE